jgi:ABC-type polar amino acid transport system ATPase subunit
MTHRLRAPIATLSGGERQRVAIIRALMMHPRVLLLDEVTSALDPVLTLDVMHMIRKLRDEGMTMVVVTHHLDFASTLCDRIMYLSDGAAVQVATPVELRTNPATAEVRAFLQVLRDAR